MNVGLEHYLVVSALLFCLGLLGVILRRNLLVIYMSLELMLNAANLALVAFSGFNGHLNGQVMVFFIITVAAATVLWWRHRAPAPGDATTASEPPLLSTYNRPSGPTAIAVTVPRPRAYT